MSHLFHRIQELKLGATALELEAIGTEVEKVERALDKAEATIVRVKERLGAFRVRGQEANHWEEWLHKTVQDAWKRAADELEACLEEPA